MTGRRVFGVETEYAVTVTGANGAALPREDYIQRLMRTASRTLPNLSGPHQTDLFLANGSRFYVDVGWHPEVAGPECQNPWDVVRYLRAGDRLLATLADRLRDETPEVGGVAVFATNVDYSGSGATWGAHESYLHRLDPPALWPGLLPHLASRVIYTGAGGFDPTGRSLAFSLSPRAAYVRQATSAESTSSRALIHTRDEPLTRHRYRRQHVLCGESLRSDLGAWLRSGVTALVVALLEAGAVAVGDVALETPVDALHAFAADPSCRRTVPDAKGRPVTAIDVQRRYLAAARAHLDAPWMPAWAPDVCRRWAGILDRLAAGPEAVADALDWAIKLRLYRRRAARAGIDWSHLEPWSFVYGRVASRLGRDAASPPPSAAAALAPGSPAAMAVRLLAPYMAERGLLWTRFDRFVALRAEFYELDTRFGQVGSNGLFSALEAAGLSGHRVDGVDRIAEALDEPPADGRARVRGEVIRRLAARPDGPWWCSWTHVTNANGGQLDLGDPFVDREIWTPPPAGAAGDAA